MKSNRLAEIKVGAAFIIALIIFVWIFGWSKNFSLVSDDKELKVEFNSAGGLETGDYITIAGVKKGYVASIEIKNGNVIVTALIENDSKIMEDAEFSIMMLDLMGGKKLSVTPGISSNEIDYSVIHKGKFAGDISTAMAVLSSVQGDLISIIEELRNTLTVVNSTLDEEFGNNLTDAVVSLKNTSDNANNLILENKKQINSLLLSTNNLVDSISVFISENKDDFSYTIDNINSLLSESKTTLNQFNNLLSETKSGGNNIGKLMYDEELVDNLKSSIRDLKELTNLLVEQLKNDGIKVEADIF